MVLGIGGVRALRALNESVDCYHFNEGHALFAGFELMREKMDDGADYPSALASTRAEVVFTTHTPIIQGNESHPIDRIVYMGANLGFSKEQLVELGGEPFNMTVGALRLSKISNAVAQLHGQTANEMWRHVPDRSEILAITNAIHRPTWVDQRLADAESDDSFWSLHMENKLLIGFSRRAAPYKRSDFIFSDALKAQSLLKDRTIQIIFSGRAHPLDDTGKGIVEKLHAKSIEYPESVVFPQNYDMEIGARLTRGAGVWLNNPRRPKEASGTSGMKAAMNGVLNLSVLDGWWPEACEHGENGWQFGDAFSSEATDEHDSHDLEALYRCLNEEVIPTYYNDRSRWISMMRRSIESTTTQFGAKRMLDEYYELMYSK
ncbi:MAG: alpha-glucan family phosphorylase [Spirochaetales bacterium]|jgi:glycogen phosphorylase|nr:alpha-glucan family phosphorylase [Spirochaetales bacterium]